jgi:hypothetical protein
MSTHVSTDYQRGRALSVTTRNGRVSKVTTWTPGSGVSSTVRWEGDLSGNVKVALPKPKR